MLLPKLANSCYYLTYLCNCYYYDIFIIIILTNVLLSKSSNCTYLLLLLTYQVVLTYHKVNQSKLFSFSKRCICYYLTFPLLAIQTLFIYNRSLVITKFLSWKHSKWKCAQWIVEKENNINYFRKIVVNHIIVKNYTNDIPRFFMLAFLIGTISLFKAIVNYD